MSRASHRTTRTLMPMIERVIDSPILSSVTDANAEFMRIMTASAEAMLTEAVRPYEVAMRLLGALGPVLSEADFAGSAYYVWGFLTDGIDGPDRYARGLTEAQIEDLMRQAATEWLALPGTPEATAQYFERWSDWPDSLSG
jgi:hypothetical protein